MLPNNLAHLYGFQIGLPEIITPSPNLEHLFVLQIQLPQINPPSRPKLDLLIENFNIVETLLYIGRLQSRCFFEETGEKQQELVANTVLQPATTFETQARRRYIYINTLALMVEVSEVKPRQ